VDVTNPPWFVHADSDVSRTLNAAKGCCLDRSRDIGVDGTSVSWIDCHRHNGHTIIGIHKENYATSWIICMYS
jgi:hypothetical protein